MSIIALQVVGSNWEHWEESLRPPQPEYSWGDCPNPPQPPHPLSEVRASSMELHIPSILYCTYRRWPDCCSSWIKAGCCDYYPGWAKTRYPAHCSEWFRAGWSDCRSQWPETSWSGKTPTHHCHPHDQTLDLWTRYIVKHSNYGD